MKKIFILFSTWAFFYIGLSIIQSCDPCSDGPLNYKLISITGEVKRINGVEVVGSYQTAYYTVEQYVPKTNGVRYDSVGIDIMNNVEFLAYDPTANFINSAFACSPATNFESLENITILSSQNYLDIYPAGTDLQEIISVREGYQLQGISIPTYLSASQLTQGNLFLTFDFPPSEDKVHNLTIKYRLLDGREYEVLIQGIKINK